MAQPANVEPGEIKKFGELAEPWWNPRGPMRSLHAINPLRLQFIMEGLDLRGRKVLDIGCGGGILTEALARQAARVTGIDLSAELLEVAREHARTQGFGIDYCLADIDQFAEEHAQDFEVVVCMEVLEHVPDPKKTLRAISRLLDPDGHAFISTVDRSVKSFWFAIVGGEYILHLLPRGSHTYGKLIRPEELKRWAGEYELVFQRTGGLSYNPFRNRFSLARKAEINYMMDFIRS